MANSDDEIRLRNEPLGYLQQADNMGRMAVNAIEHGDDRDREAAPTQAALANAYAIMALASALLHHTTAPD